MSETAKSTVETVKRSAAAAIDASSKTTKDSIGETSQLAQNAAEKARQAGQSMTEAVAQSAQAATTVSTKAVEQGREVMMMGLHTAAGVGGQVADSGFGRGRHLLTSAVHVMDIYRDASERSAMRMQALMSSAMTLGRGLQQMQHAWLEMLDQAVEHAAHRPQDLLRCKTMVEVAEVQRDLYMDTVNHVFRSSSRMLEMAGRTAQDAVRPLQTLSQ